MDVRIRIFVTRYETVFLKIAFIITDWVCEKFRENVTLSKDPIIFVWNKEGKINDYISSDKPYSAYLLERHVPKRDLVIYNHNVGESTCADWIQDLIKLSYEKKPHSLVISFDMSGLVSNAASEARGKSINCKLSLFSSLQTCNPKKLPLKIRHIQSVCEKMYKVEEFTSKAYNLLIFAANYADYYYPKSDKRRVQLSMRRHPIAFLLKTLKKIKWGKLVSFDTVGNIAQAVVGKCNDEISYPICTS